MRRSLRSVSTVGLCLGIALASAAAGPQGTQRDGARQRADAALDRALEQLVAMPDGPPGAIALVQRGSDLAVHAAGTADVATGRTPESGDAMRIASVSKAFSGAAALALVDQGVLSLDDDIGKWRPDLPAAWHEVTLRQLLHHTSGLPDFSASKAFQEAVAASFAVALTPRELLEFVVGEPLRFPPGQEFRYSNSDNVTVGLIIETATGAPYEEALQAQVAMPLGLAQTTLPAGTEIPSPYIHGYDLERKGPPDDRSTLLAAGWAWASGGIVSTPEELNRFIRGYVGGALFGSAVRAQQLDFIEGGESEPAGPGRNAAGLALFRYDTRCGTVYGHTGNTFGYTQFAAASPGGDRSTTVSINLQRTNHSGGLGGAVFLALQRAELLAVCAALAD